MLQKPQGEMRNYENKWLVRKLASPASETFNLLKSGREFQKLPSPSWKRREDKDYTTRRHIGLTKCRIIYGR